MNKDSLEILQNKEWSVKHRVRWTQMELEHILLLAPMRFNEAKATTNYPANFCVEIFVNEEWLHLSRTDLLDDVCTTRFIEDIEKNRQHLLRNIKHYYGARLNIYQDGKTFAIIDSLTDG